MTDPNPARTFRLHLRGRCPTCEQAIPTEQRGGSMESLREALAEKLASLYAHATSHGTVECDWTDDADALLTGPLVGLVADAHRLRRVEAAVLAGDTPVAALTAVVRALHGVAP